PSRTVISSPSSVERSVARFGLPLGRPFGLPDCPGLNRVALGGLRYPTAYSLGTLSLFSVVTLARVRFTGIRVIDPPPGGDLGKGQPEFGMARGNAGGL